MARRTIGVLCLGLVGLVPGVARAQTEQVYYYHMDAVGSVRMITNESGQEITRYDFWPFGQVSGSPAVQDSRMFAGTERDGESGLDYFGARHYASGIGRFATVDPAGAHLSNPQTFNRYAYAGNNPLRFTDPTGLDFYLQCERESDTCHDGRAGTYVNSEFQKTVVTSASLHDSTSGNIAVVNGDGVLITNGQGTFQGVFINGTPSADIMGDPNAAGWNQFSFHIDSSNLDRGVTAQGIALYLGSGDKQAMLNAIEALRVNGRGPFHYQEEAFGNPFHPGAQNFRFSSGPHPELFNYGPSAHFPVPGEAVNWSEFHVDSKTGPAHLTCAVRGVWCF